MMEKNMINDEELNAVNGGTSENQSNVDPLDPELHRTTWCGNCKKMVPYTEFSGGRDICAICGKFVKV
ncbi:MAG: hypothetical protein J5518_12120 [Lachnospiraceae bacterium]|nr:hypothetical protein [Lachnospiraceae bacterium]